MRSKKQRLKAWKIYPILDNGMFPDMREFVNKFFELINSPVDAVQIRLKELDGGPVFRTARMMVAEAAKKNIPVIINDRPELAFALGSAGVHLGKSDIPASIARQMLGAGAVIGRTVRNKQDLIAADVKDYDYAAIGPVFYSPLKKDLKPVSFPVIREVCAVSEKPVIAVGGINADNAARVMAQGVQVVAFMRYAVSESDTRRRIEELRKVICAGETKQRI